MKIRTKIIALFFLFSLVPLAVIASFAYLNGRQSLSDMMFQHLETASVLKENQINFWYGDSFSAFKGLFHHLEELVVPLSTDHPTTFPNPEDSRKIIDELHSLLAEYPEFIELFLMDPTTGRIDFSTDEPHVGMIKFDDPYFTEGLKGLFIKNIYFSNTLNAPALSISSPLADTEGNPRFVFAARVNLAPLSELMSLTSGLGNTGETIMVNKNSILVSQSKQGLPLFSFVSSPDITLCLEHKTGSGFNPDYMGIPVAVRYRWIPEHEICLIAKQWQSEAFQTIWRFALAIALASAVLVLLVILLGIRLSSSISAPIIRLAKSAHSIATGRAHLLPTTTASDEIGELNNSLAVMTHNLVSSAEESMNIIQAIPDPFLVLDEKGLIRLANQVAIRLSRHPSHQIRGLPFHKLIQFKGLRTREKNEASMGQLIASLSKRGAQNLQMEFLARTGDLVPMNASISTHRDTRGHILEYLLIAKDVRGLHKYAKERVDLITPVLNRISLGDFSVRMELPSSNDEFTDLIISINLMSDNLKELVEENQNKATQIDVSRKQLETSHEILKKAKNAIEAEKSKAEALLGSIGEGILAIDLHGRVMQMNQQAEKMFDAKLNMVGGGFFTEHFHFEDLQGKPFGGDHPYFKRVAQTKTQLFTTTFFVKPNRTRVPLATTISPILFGQKMLGIIGTFRDITHEMEIDRAKSEFVSLASHQLRTPLTAVKWLLEELMRKGRLSSDQLDKMKDVQASTSRLITLVNDLLNVSRLESGVLTIEPKSVELGKWIADAIKEYRFGALEKRQRIEFEKPKTPINLSVDPELYRQLLDNMVSNAIKYSPNGKTIFIRLQKKPHGVTLSVQDQGIGMTIEERKSLFTKFYRTAEAAKFSTTSSGLGLYIMKKILDISGGSVTIDSEKGKGTVISITYPLKGMIEKKGAKRLV